MPRKFRLTHFFKNRDSERRKAFVRKLEQNHGGRSKIVVHRNGSFYLDPDEFLRSKRGHDVIDAMKKASRAGVNRSTK